ncbi:FkbM family methyltransferase [Arenimonas sp.]|uniref:FkbM family methyltransferase n=1 Tax=Arenimonas sp. TaxID=1872635 RepID=UPI0039E53401
MSSTRLINRILRRAGFELRRVRADGGSKVAAVDSFYRPHPSCQVRELANLYKLLLGERTDGLFVEVGAFDGTSFSNTSCLADVGWSGILVEPVPEFATACRSKYADHPGIRVVEAAVGAAAGVVELTVAGTLTTASKSSLEAYKGLDWAAPSVSQAHVISVEQLTLDSILTDAGVNRPIDVLVVDVEGGEADVFAGFSMDRWQPTLMIVELEHTHPDLHRVSRGDAVLQRTIEEHGYSVVYKDAINTVFASRDAIARSF